MRCHSVVVVAAADRIEAAEEAVVFVVGSRGEEQRIDRLIELTVAELEAVVCGAIGTSELMEFVRFDSGDVLRKERGGQGPKMLRLVVGNPLIMKEMAKAVPDAASYAPVTILIDERADGVHLSYDSMASLIAPYGSEAALVVARGLDAKVETLLEAAAR